MKLFREYTDGFNWASQRRRPSKVGIAPAPLVDEDLQPYPICEVWAVVTSINEPTKTIKQLAALSGICVVVVADLKSPESFGLEKVVYLTPEIQVTRKLYIFLSDICTNMRTSERPSLIPFLVNYYRVRLRFVSYNTETPSLRDCPSSAMEPLWKKKPGLYFCHSPWCQSDL
jgi:hypothetical protein